MLRNAYNYLLVVTCKNRLRHSRERSRQKFAKFKFCKLYFDFSNFAAAIAVSLSPRGRVAEVHLHLLLLLEPQRLGLLPLEVREAPAALVVELEGQEVLVRLRPRPESPFYCLRENEKTSSTPYLLSTLDQTLEGSISIFSKKYKEIA